MWGITRKVRQIIDQSRAKRDLCAAATLTELLAQRHVNAGDFQPDRDFFGQTLAVIRTLDAMQTYAHNNFSGEWSASQVDNCTAIFNHIRQNQLLKPGERFCDIGASRGRLTRMMQDQGVPAYAIDGTDYGVRHKLLDCDPARYAVYDFRIRIDVESFRRFFGLVTSFEVLEHIPVEHLDTFLDNMAHISSSCLVSIHHGGNEAENHYTVRDLDWWLAQFNKRGQAKAVVIPPLDQKWTDSSIVYARFS